MTFFKEHTKFLETSTVAPNVNRLNFRYNMIIEQNIELVKDKVVLDIASHDGRFSMAALKGGGAHRVIGIEARQSLVDAAEATFEHYNVDKDSYEFICGDAFTSVAKLPKDTIDTAMILGFLYHTARQFELIASISELGIKNIIIDSNVLVGEKRPVVLLRWEKTDKDSNTWDKQRSKVLSSIPTNSALVHWLEEFGYTASTITPKLKIPKSAQQYRTGRRVTLTGSRS